MFIYKIFRSFGKVGNYKKGNFINLLLWWDIGKKRIKSLTIDYCKEKRRTERIYIQNLKYIEKRLTHLSELGQMDDTTELFSIQDKIKDYDYKQLNGARLRAKVQKIKQGERCRPTSYFVNLEKQRANNKKNEFVINRGRNFG